MEIGDEIVAINPCTMEGSNINALIVGKSYYIENINSENEIEITSEEGPRHQFNLEQELGDDNTFYNYFKLPIKEKLIGGQLV